MTKAGTILGLGGHPMSGLWTLSMAGDDGSFDAVHIGSGHGVRQLARAFGVREGIDDLLEAIQGERIVYTVDGLGVMECFTPLDEWPGPVIPAEGIEDDELRELLEEDEWH